MSKQINRLSTQRPGDLDELDHIDASFPDLDLGNERLRAFKTSRQFLLTDPRFFSGFHKRRTQCQMGTGSQGFQARTPRGWCAYI